MNTFALKTLRLTAALASAVALVTVAVLPAHAATPVAAQKTVAYKDNKALVTAYLQALFVEKDLATVEKFWGKDMIQHNPSMPNGLDVLRGILGKIGPEFRYEQGLTMQQGNMVMVHGRYVGWGPKPMVAVDIFRIEAGKIVEHWDVMQEEVSADKSANGNAMFPAK